MAEEGAERTSLSKRVREEQKKRAEENRAKAREIITRSPTGLDKITEEKIKEETGKEIGKISGEPEPK